MPAYQFHRLAGAGVEPEPFEEVFFSDTAAIRHAIGPVFPEGCDVWQAMRYVGRFHAATDRIAPAAELAAKGRKATVAG